MAYSVSPLPTVKINQLSEHVDLISVHFPPLQLLSPSQVKSASCLILGSCCSFCLKHFSFPPDDIMAAPSHH